MQYHIVGLGPSELTVTFSLMGEPICFMTIEHIKLDGDEFIAVTAEQLHGERRNGQALFYLDGVFREGRNVEVVGYWYYQCLDDVKQRLNLH